jgi:hypothetical protein
MLDATIEAGGQRQVLCLSALTGCWEYRPEPCPGRDWVPVGAVARVREHARLERLRVAIDAMSATL